MGLPKGNAAKRMRNQAIAQQADELFRNKRYQENMQEWRREDTRRAIAMVILESMVYLETKHGYKKKGLASFLNFFLKDITNITNDPKYLEDANKYYKDILGMDVAEELGVKMTD